jgi:sucrose phosphorylase
MLSTPVLSRLREHLGRLYGEPRATETLPRLAGLLDGYPVRRHAHGRTGSFDQTDVVLSCYPDQVQEPGRAPLETLSRLLDSRIGPVVSGLHLLPLHPSTSDDGFAVSDYAEVDPAYGDWGHVRALADRYRLMLDAVVNHTSAAHPWFTGWLSGDPAYVDFYVTPTPGSDLSAVTRPRTTPLLTPYVDADRRQRIVWTTFSADQVDLDYANPDVLLAITEVLLSYLQHGAGMLRLDAVGFLWKQPGTSCIHLPQTHEIVRLWRTVVDAVAPGTLLVTETNVPHDENVAYFGNGDDEAHLVYQFALPPLVLAAFQSGNGQRLQEWAGSLRTPSDQTTYLNFLASHDGIGLRPVEGLLRAEEVERLCAAVRRNGGRVSYRTGPDDSERPYELNAVYLDAISGREGRARRQGSDRDDVARFLAAHSILLALAGVPMLYFHSLFGSRNWVDGVNRSGQARAINRERLSFAGLLAELDRPGSGRRQILDMLLHLITVRTREPAFHPNAPQAIVPSEPSHFVVQRTSPADDTTVICVHDVSGRAGRFRGRARDRLPGGAPLLDLCDGSEHLTEADGTIDVDIPPYGVRWLRVR